MNVEGGIYIGGCDPLATLDRLSYKKLSQKTTDYSLIFLGNLGEEILVATCFRIVGLVVSLSFSFLRGNRTHE